MTSLLALAFMSFMQVFLLGFQSRCVNSGRYTLSFATSTMIGLAQVYTFQHIAKAHDIAAALTYSLSGACAIVTAIYVFQRFVKEKK